MITLASPVNHKKMNKKYLSYFTLFTLILCFFDGINTASAQSDTSIYRICEKDPEYPGGIEGLYQFLVANINYPELAIEEDIQGKVYVTFIVDIDGSIKWPRVVKDIGGGCGQEALRVIKLMPKWIPGQNDGKPVCVQFTLPISFNLQPTNELSSDIFSSFAPSGQNLWFKKTSPTDVFIIFPSDDYKKPYKGFTKPNGNILIPEKITHNGFTYNVVGIGDYAFFECKDLKDITIPNSIKQVYKKAFAGCTNAKITLLGSAKSCASDAFEGCQNVTREKNATTTSNRSANHSQSSSIRHTRIYTSEKDIRDDIDKQNDGIVGVYRNISTGIELAVIKYFNDYIIVYIDEEMENLTWACGDLKAELIPSATTGLFQAEWYMSDNTINSKCLVIFDGSTMKVVTDKEEMTLLKMYPYVISNGNNSLKTTWSGSGFALSGRYVVTNNHVIDDAKTIAIMGINGDMNTGYTAEVVATDRNNDIAVLKINDPRFKGFGTIPYAISSRIADKGEGVFVLGYPMTQVLGNEVKYTAGEINSRTGFQGDVATYQISAPVTHGNSGGPMFDNRGNVIGIVNSGISDKEIAENVGYAIKISYLKILIESAGLNITLPQNNTIANLSKQEKIKKVEKFVYYIECSK